MIRLYKDTARELANWLQGDLDRMDTDADRQPIEWYILLQQQLARIVPEREGLDAADFVAAMEETIMLGLRAINCAEVNGAAHEITDWVEGSDDQTT